MTQTYPSGLLSLSYHIIFSDDVRKAFRDDSMSVAQTFGLTADEKQTILNATQSGVYNPQDAAALCAFMKVEVQQNLSAPVPPSDGPDPAEAPPAGMLSAAYHVYIARDPYPLASYDLTQADDAAIQSADLEAVTSAMSKDFNQRYKAVYDYAW